MRSKLIVILSLMVCGNGLAYGYTFGEYAADVGLTGDETDISAEVGITDLPGLANNYPALEDLSSLTSFNLSSNPLTSMVLSDTTLSQGAFDAFMDGGVYSWLTGIAEMPGVLELDMSGVDFSGISDLSKMYTMDGIEELLLIDAINLDGIDVSHLTIELASLDLLNVALRRRRA